MLQRIVCQSGVVFYQSPLLSAVGVAHGFSTRLGGVSPEPFASMNLGNPSGCEAQDDWDRIYENYRRLQRDLGMDGRQRCWVHQVHGGDAVFVRQDREFASGARADVMLSNDPGRTIAVRTADCVPILMASASGKCVAAVHAGWRGVIAGAVVNAFRQLQREAGDDIVAAIGPCIGFEHFEVGAEVLEQFREQFGAEAPIADRGNGKGRVDLRKAVLIQLVRAGLPEAKIDLSDRCTYRDSDEFFSHRRDRGVTGRMAALIAAGAS